MDSAQANNITHTIIHLLNQITMSNDKDIKDFICLVFDLSKAFDTIRPCYPAS